MSYWASKNLPSRPRTSARKFQIGVFVVSVLINTNQHPKLIAIMQYMTHSVPRLSNRGTKQRHFRFSVEQRETETEKRHRNIAAMI